MKQHEIVHTDFSCAYPIQQFFYFSSGSLEVELAKGHLRPADGVADSFLQLSSAGFALRVAEFFQGTAQILALQPGWALSSGGDVCGRSALLATLLRYGHVNLIIPRA